nr:MAG TPA: hypothetical protein [Bacteriophage sp.]
MTREQPGNNCGSAEPASDTVRTKTNSNRTL